MFLWTQAINTTTYLLNMSPIRVDSGMTPLEKYTRINLDLNHLRIFGCVAHVHVDKKNRNKLESKSTCNFMGYETTSRNYHCYNPLLEKVVVSRDIQFEEDIDAYTNQLKLMTSMK